MHADERRNPQELTEPRRQLADGPSAWPPSGTSSSGDGSASATGSQGVEGAEASGPSCDRRNEELTRRLGSANAALDAYRAETARLKGDLRRVRGSRAYRLGRTLSATR